MIGHAGGRGLLGLGLLAATALGALSLLARAGGEGREEKLREDRERVSASGFWIYDDLAKGLKEAKASGKPLVVALRCIPCEECVRLDEDLVDTSARLRPLLERFVRVRLIRTNGLDLHTFQFDTDQSFAVFLLRADGTIYGRYGTRSDARDWADDVSIEGLAQALEGALDMHDAWPRDRGALADKRGPRPRVKTPEAYPTLREKYGPTLAKDGPVVPSCIHCHQIGDAERAEVLARGPLPDEDLFPHPHPKALGLVLDPRARATVKEVTPGSSAEAAGFLPGDAIERLGGQPLLSIADVQWVLHRVGARGASLPAVVRRGEATVELGWTLGPGWRGADDIAWRVSTWPLRQRALGGMRLQPAAGGAASGLRIAHVGAYPPHHRAKQVGLRRGDLLVSFDGRSDFERETDLLAFALQRAQRPRTVPVVVRRGDEVLTVQLPIGP